MKIKNAFERHALPALEYSKPGEQIALRHALRNYLGRDSGLPAVIRAVVDGALVPVAYTSRFPGITGYLFPSDRLRRYRPVRGTHAPAEGFLNYREAAAVLGVGKPVIRGLVAQSVLSAHVEFQAGLPKLIPVGDVRRFAERYVAATAVAKRFNLTHWSFVRYLKQSSTPLLAVPVPEAGWRPVLFLQREVAAHMRVLAGRARHFGSPHSQRCPS
jgi:hypothetical protein